MIKSVACVLLGLLGGCGQHYNVQIDSLAAPNADAARRYVLLPGDPGVDVHSLQYQEFATYAKRALKWRGFSPAASNEQADVMITLSYGISGPHDRYRTVDVPEYGPTGEVVEQTHGTVKKGKHHTEHYSYTTRVTPTYGVVGYRQETQVYQTYTSRIGLRGASPGGRELWTLTASYDGPVNDLREVAPALFAASAPYIAHAPENKIIHKGVFEKDKKVQYILTGYWKNGKEPKAP